MMKICKNIIRIVFVLGVFALFPQNVFGQSASFYLSPANGTYGISEQFFVHLMVNADGLAVNASQGEIYFPADKLEVVSISKGGSIFSLWVKEPTFSNTNGVISFGGGLPNPGFIGKGNIISVLFRGKTVGDATVTLGKEKILANDSHGTDVFSFSAGGKYTIIRREGVIPSPKPEPGAKPPVIIDNEPPYPFEIIVDNGGDPTNPSPLLYFETRDDLSPMSHYEIKIEENAFTAKPGETMPWKIPFLAPGNYHVSVKAFDTAKNFAESSAEVKVSSIVAPKITICPKVFRSGEEILYLGGTGLTNSRIIIFFESGGKLIKKWEAKTDEIGDWSFVNDGLFRPGNYQIFVRTQDERGAISNFSDPCVTQVILNAVAIGPWIISYRVFVLILLLLLALILLLLFWLFSRNVRNRRALERETEDLEKKFFKEYYELREDIRKELEMFRKSHGKRGLTKAEKEIEKSLLKNLTDIEVVLKKELKDIEDIKM
ncbi:MAG: hypothetical protein ABIF89_00100 [bacterium]